MAVAGPDGVEIVNVATRSFRPLVDVKTMPGTELDWSPDDSTIVTVADNSVISISLADGSVKTLAARPPVPSPGGETSSCIGSVGPAKWSPDGLLIAYEERRCVDEGNLQYMVSETPIIDANGVFHHQVDNLVWGFTPDFGPADFVWSPDSRLLAFIDDADFTEGTQYLETAMVSPLESYKRLKAGAWGGPAWQRVVP